MDEYIQRAGGAHSALMVTSKLAMFFPVKVGIKFKIKDVIGRRLCTSIKFIRNIPPSQFPEIPVVTSHAAKARSYKYLALCMHFSSHAYSSRQTNRQLRHPCHVSHADVIICKTNSNPVSSMVCLEEIYVVMTIHTNKVVMPTSYEKLSVRTNNVTWWLSVLMIFCCFKCIMFY